MSYCSSFASSKYFCDNVKEIELQNVAHHFYRRPQFYTCSTLSKILIKNAFALVPLELFE